MKRTAALVEAFRAKHHTWPSVKASHLAFSAFHAVCMTDLLEVECQVCCYNGNFHQVNHMLMLPAVEVLTYIQ